MNVRQSLTKCDLVCPCTAGKPPAVPKPKPKPKKTARVTLRLTEKMRWRLELATDEDHHNSSITWLVLKYVNDGLARDRIPTEKPK